MHVMQVLEENKSSKWLALESPKISYTALLIRIKHSLGEREMRKKKEKKKLKELNQ